MFARPWGTFAIACAVMLLAPVAPTPQAGQGPLPPVSQPSTSATRTAQIANYTIAARLDPSTRTITGTQTLHWVNPAKIPATSLQFHLYYNAWRDNDSSWMRERRLAGDTELWERPQEDRGWIDVTSVRIAGSDVTSTSRFIAPDDGNTADRTVLEVPLAAPIAPGGSVSLEMAWTSHVPRTFSRTGAIGNFFFLAQWFPKIGVLEDSGWNCHQFHAPTEFYANFGTYDVQLRVPTGWIVGATGTETARRDEGDGTTTHRYQQSDVHDFAWTTSPDYIEKVAQFEHPTLPAVRMRLLLQPEHEAQAERHFAATRAALKYYGEWFGPYPYGHITVIDPAWQSGAGGMEYPTLFTAGTRWLAPANVTQPESVTIHEAGHQFWYGIVASNEFEHAWMDEGLNTYSTARTIEQAFHPNFYAKRYFGGFIPWRFNDLPIARATDGNRLSPYRPVAEADAQSTPTWKYFPGSASAITYNKTALWLNTLERMVGWDVMQRIMSTYFARWSFKHPKPEDFFAVVNEVSGQDLTWFFDQVYRSSNVFDYGVESMRSDRVAEGGPYRTVAVVRRYGEATFPVDVRITLEDGQELRQRWDGLDRWKAIQIDNPVRARSVEIDPERVLLLDINYTNNSVTLQSHAAEWAAEKWSLAWLIWLQDHLLTYGFFI